MIRVMLSTTLIAHIARSTRCLLVAATMALTTALTGGMLQGPAAAYAGGHWSKPVRSHITTFLQVPRTYSHHPRKADLITKSMPHRMSRSI